MLHEIRVGTRGSRLALWQANAVVDRLTRAGGPPCRIVTIRTTGDQLQEAPLSREGGKRLFVKEIEDALLRGDIDVAVHSSKDMPVILPEGLAIGGVLPREDPRDAVVLPARAEGLGLRAQGVSDQGLIDPGVSDQGLSDPGVSPQPSTLTSALNPQPSALTLENLVALLGQAPSIGTSSVRRIAQLTRLFPHARFQPIRGNLDTRLRKLDQGEHDALVLAAAGLRRLGFAARISMTLPATVCVPAPGQGIVAIELRDGDSEIGSIVARISDRDAAAALDAERAVVEALGGGCQTPIGALATPTDSGELELVGTVVALDGSRAVRAVMRGAPADARLLGRAVGVHLLSEGAGEILHGSLKTATED